MEHPVFMPGWETVSLLGESANSKVYKIKNCENGEIFALKVINISFDQDSRDEELVKQELLEKANRIVNNYKVLARFNGCSQIVVPKEQKIVLKSSRSALVLVSMELLETLPRICLKNDFDEKRIIKLGIDICKALECFQSQQMIHKNIKLQNILCDANGNFKLSDFGINFAQNNIMSFSYASPQVYQNKNVDLTTDIYSLGLILYWLANERRHPFVPLPPRVPTPKENISAHERRFNGETIPAPCGCSEELKSIILKACSYTPEGRYQSATEFREALEALQENAVLPVGGAVEAGCKKEAEEKNVASLDETVLLEDAPNVDLSATSNGGENQSFPKAKKSKKGLIVVVIILLLAAIAAGVFIFFYFSGSTSNKNADSSFDETLSSSSDDSTYEEVSIYEEHEIHLPVENKNSIDVTQLVFNATSGEKNATAFWFVTYEDEGLSISVYVADEVTMNNDGVEFVLGMVSSSSSFVDGKALKCVATADGNINTKMYENGSFSKDVNITLYVEGWQDDVDFYQGYVVNVKVPYDVFEVSAEEAYSNLAIAPALINNNGEGAVMKYTTLLSCDANSMNGLVKIADDNLFEVNPFKNN